VSTLAELLLASVLLGLDVARRARRACRRRRRQKRPVTFVSTDVVSSFRGWN
jgi:hypothetical protein